LPTLNDVNYALGLPLCAYTLLEPSNQFSRLLPQLENCGSHDSPVSNSALTAAEDASRWSRYLQLALAARKLDHKYVLVGDNATQLAADCLSSIALGRGGSVATQLAFSDSRYGDVTFLRPLYDFLANEVVYLLRFSGLSPVIEPTLTVQQTLSRGPGLNSIQRLTSDFISSLQFGGFPSTCKAVLRWVLPRCCTVQPAFIYRFPLLRTWFVS
uniref:AAA_8 domain-containing protein n=1 Tax=Schistocephalus solidus TaxID=70667 RepID=A0A183TEF9_SCHSO